MSDIRSSSRTDPTRQIARCDPLIRRVVRTIGDHEMLRAGDRVLIGVSSGPDSMVLLHVLHRLSGRLDICLAVAHLDHGLRPQAAGAEAHLVRETARRLGLQYYMDQLQPVPGNGSLEERLRELRYAFFTRTASSHDFSKIAVGHHADDNAEAVLMHMLRGSGLRGLSGIPPVRGNIIRPLIDLRRSDILAYAQRHNLPFMQDASNLDTRFERNRIRHDLIPLLEKQYNPNVVRTLNRTAALCREEDRWRSALVAPIADQMTRRSDARILELETRCFASAPRALQRHLLRETLGRWQGHLRRIGARHIDALLAMLRRDRRIRRLHLPFGVAAETSDGILRFRRIGDLRRAGRPEKAPSYCYTLPALEEDRFALRIDEARLVLRFSVSERERAGLLTVSEERTALLDYDRLVFPLTVRSFQPGDRFHPFGSQGRQKVKKLFIDRKIPEPRRMQMPLLVCAGVILWVVGVRRGSAAAVTPGTRRVLRVDAEAV